MELAPRNRHASSRLLFIYGPTVDDYQSYAYDGLVELMQHPKYDANRSTVLFIHGFKESGTKGSAAVIADAYVTRTDHNLIILDWEREASVSYYFYAVQNSVKVSEKKT